eukprot:scaffold57240_cov36-Cyclotella_meneghiniana.AAC.2
MSRICSGLDVECKKVGLSYHHHHPFWKRHRTARGCHRWIRKILHQSSVASIMSSLCFFL